MRSLAPACAALAAALLVGLGPAGAAPRHHRVTRHIARAAPLPPADAVELGSIAPPTRLGTLEQTYGDAAVARAQIRATNGRLEARAQLPGSGAARLASSPCDPRIAVAGGELCASAPPDGIGYGQFDAFTPAYVSAPTTVGQNAAVQEPIMPAVTSLFYGFDGFLSGARD